MPQNDEIYLEEANILGRYLVKRSPGKRACALYLQAMRESSLPSVSEAKYLDFAYRHPWSLGFLDAGLALLQPHAELRRRIYLMFAILEAQPEYWACFFSQGRRFRDGLEAAFSGLRAAIRALGGVILVKALK